MTTSDVKGEVGGAVKEILTNMGEEMRLADMALKNLEMSAAQLLTEYECGIDDTIDREIAMWLRNFYTKMKFQHADILKAKLIFENNVLSKVNTDGGQKAVANN